jgi:DNA-binding NarL/FixJ family response regulator
MCEWLLPLAARALADEAQSLRDEGCSPDPPLRQLDEVVDRFPHIIADLGGSTEFYTRELAALDALYAAEVARARAVPDAAQAWASAVALLEGVLPWEQAYACWRAGEAQLVSGSGRRDDAAVVLRRGLELAERLQALPVRAEIEELGRTARIPLTPVAASSGSRPSGGGLPGSLTPREREILEHIVAGRTYGEIARALVLSEKTVSSHVSNLLRKTGAANRVDLARLATHGRRDLSG